VGFHYLWDEQTQQYAHASGIMIATPEGKARALLLRCRVSRRVICGLGLVEASQNKIGTPVDTLMLYCYHYDPSTGKYGAVVMNIMRVAGVMTLLLIGGMLLVLRKIGRRRQAGCG
jgi:protein SCO1/2